MQMSKQTIILASMLMLTLLAPTTSQALDFAVDVHAGFNGNGIGAAIPLGKRINLRVGTNSGEYGFDIDDPDNGGLDFNGDYELDNQYVKVDFYISKRGIFHGTVGYIANDNSITLGAIIDDNVTRFGSETALNGTRVSGSVSFDKSSYYLGAGVGNAFGKRNTFHLGFEWGIMFMQVDPDLTLAVDYPGFASCANGDPTCIGQDDIDTEEVQRESDSDLEAFTALPIINFRFGYRF